MSARAQRCCAVGIGTFRHFFCLTSVPYHQNALCCCNSDDKLSTGVSNTRSAETVNATREATFLCQTISAKLQRLTTRHSRNKRLSRVDFHVTAAAGKVTIFIFLEISSISAPTSRTLEIVARTSGTSKFFSKECSLRKVQVCKCGPQH